MKETCDHCGAELGITICRSDKGGARGKKYCSAGCCAIEIGMGRCKDCRHWGHTNEVAPYKLCRLHSDYQRTDGWLHTDGPISTSFNFGCVAFEAKGAE